MAEPQAKRVLTAAGAAAAAAGQGAMEVTGDSLSDLQALNKTSRGFEKRRDDVTPAIVEMEINEPRSPSVYSAEFSGLESENKAYDRNFKTTQKLMRNAVPIPKAPAKELTNTQKVNREHTRKYTSIEEAQQFALEQGTRVIANKRNPNAPFMVRDRMYSILRKEALKADGKGGRQTRDVLKYYADRGLVLQSTKPAVMRDYKLAPVPKTRTAAQLPAANNMPHFVMVLQPVSGKFNAYPIWFRKFVETHAVYEKATFYGVGTLKFGNRKEDKKTSQLIWFMPVGDEYKYFILVAPLRVPTATVKSSGLSNNNRIAIPISKAIADQAIYAREQRVRAAKDRFANARSAMIATTKPIENKETVGWLALKKLGESAPKIKPIFARKLGADSLCIIYVQCASITFVTKNDKKTGNLISEKLKFIKHRMPLIVNTRPAADANTAVIKLNQAGVLAEYGFDALPIIYSATPCFKTTSTIGAAIGDKSPIKTQTAPVRPDAVDLTAITGSLEGVNWEILSTSNIWGQTDFTSKQLSIYIAKLHAISKFLYLIYGLCKVNDERTASIWRSGAANVPIVTAGKSLAAYNTPNAVLTRATFVRNFLAANPGIAFAPNASESRMLDAYAKEAESLNYLA